MFLFQLCQFFYVMVCLGYGFVVEVYTFVSFTPVLVLVIVTVIVIRLSRYSQPLSLLFAVSMFNIILLLFC
jgi:hypothetical protein